MFKRKYWIVIGLYILMQALSVIIPIYLYNQFQLDYLSSAIYANIVLFFLATVAIVSIMWREIRSESLAHPMNIDKIIGWTALGLLLAWVGEFAASYFLFEVVGVDSSSENSEIIIQIAKMNPLFIVSAAILGPILEEIIFRKILFGYLNEKFNVWIAAFVSSLIFGLVHMEMQTLIVYMVMGLVFAYIYWKTKRIIIPILVHVSINSFAVLIPLVVNVEKLEKMQEELMIFLNL